MYLESYFEIVWQLISLSKAEKDYLKIFENE